MSRGDFVFDCVFCINLTRRPDRLADFQASLPADWPYPAPTRFEAIDWRNVPAPDWWTAGAGAWGAYRSHATVLESCLNRGVDSVLVLEDDAVFCKGFTLKANEFLDRLPTDWSWVFLGGQHIKRFNGLPEKISAGVYKPYNVNRSHAYGIRGSSTIRKIYRHLMSTMNWPHGNHVDHQLGALCESNPGIYVPGEWLIGQRAGKSNIAGKVAEEKFFRGAQSLADPASPRSVILVSTADERLADFTVGLLEILGVDMGIMVDNQAKPCSDGRWACEAPGLHRVCTQLSGAGGGKPRLDHRSRVLHFRDWSAKRQRSLAAGKRVGGCNRLLDIFAEDLGTAWAEGTLISAERDPAGGVCFRCLDRSIRLPQGIASTGPTQEVGVSPRTAESANSLVDWMVEIHATSGRPSDIELARSYARRFLF